LCFNGSVFIVADTQYSMTICGHEVGMQADESVAKIERLNSVRCELRNFPHEPWHVARAVMFFYVAR
jgi:hypothetical protein